MEGFTITHYTFAREDDPVYANDKEVEAKGLEGKYRENFLYGPRGVIMQGTGLTRSGDYITIDWGKGRPKGRDTTFKKGIGGSWKSPKEWESIAVDPSVIPLGSRVEIELYPTHTFLAWDKGGNIKGNRIDVFIGAVNLSKANAYGRKTSRVRIKK
jgi:3D (Asp-Asp-Asp) domain-containing protein